MKKISCIILDDEPMAVSLLSKYIEKVSIFNLVKATTSPFEIAELVTHTNIDVLFIDIQMPELTGIQLMKMIGHKSKFVITSAYSEYALEGYEHNVVDYLLKPISFDRFYKAVLKINDLFKDDFLKIAIKAEEKRDNFLFVKTDGKLVKINLEDLLFIEGLKDYLYLHLKSEKLITLDTLKNFETKLSQKKFMRIHKSYIVNLNAVETVERNRVFIQNKIIPVGESYKVLFQKWIEDCV
ncbi:LytR/AlgR family response regulator transcription factor [Myroides indicus]|uniref:LytTR family two component transcriptional regulator n=1 Tax=Myroides indicus TaxID=1323422 RepID=A0A4R7F4A7_9FLAO|nr:LytTR family DNA-binding domain-containing protein [Myroides indicus]TDS64363.1 LytTR family two component transcriptional regulator [Myroides indicus]